jgi:DMSO/TMAO reductase YedYZ molybdopterin-dependent catalytic subunit
MRRRVFLTAFAFILAFVASSHRLVVEAAQSGKKTCQGGYSSRFSLTGEVNHPATYDRVSLARLPHSIVNVTFLTKTGSQSASFRGVLLWNLLITAGIKSDRARRGRFRYVEVTATDCYQVVLALAELDPNFAGEQVLVADSQNGSPLGSDAGFARLIVPGDKFGGRDTFWIQKIEVLSGPPPS